MRKYRNIKTGAVIEIKSEAKGGDWQEILPASKPQNVRRKQVVKK